jgi:surfeit locus 1 family protein
VTALRFDFEWRLTLFTALLLPLLIGLGFWQLQRADEKRDIAVRQEVRAAQAPRPLSMLDDGDGMLAYRRVIVSGYFLPEALIYKDNQLRNGRFGYDVLGVFFDRPGARWVLLNRGWVPADPARRSLPEVDVPTGEQRLEASIYVSPGQPYSLGETDFSELAWPLVVQDPAADALRAALERELDAPLFPLVLRLAPGQPGGFRRDWPLVNASPARHTGYAVQWFTMAAVLALLFTWRCSNIGEVLTPNRKDHE